jgi:integrase
MTAVARIPHLERREAGFFFRRRLPRRTGSDVPIQKRFLLLSLRTHVPADAKDLARRLSALSDIAFAGMTEWQMDHLSAEQIGILEALARFQIAAHARIRASAPPRSEDAARAAAACEQAAQAVLRRALATGDREEARAPLRAVAQRLGLHLEEDTEDWNRLAFEAVRLLLDLSVARERAELGVYDGPSPVFQSIRAQTARTVAAGFTAAPERVGAVATPPAVTTALVMEIGDAPPLTLGPARTSKSVPGAATPSTAPETAAATHTPDHPPVSAPLLLDTCAEALGDEIGYLLSEEAARRALARPPLLNTLPMDKLSPRIQAILSAKPRGISVTEAIDLMAELKALGLGDDFGNKQEIDEAAGKKWMKDSGSKLKFARRFWPEFVGDGPFEEVDENAVLDALAFLPSVPNKHSKGTETWAPTVTFVDLVERCELEEELDRAERIKEIAKNPTATEADREAAARYPCAPRLRADTIVKHRRMIKAVGSMLVALRLADTNPFDICKVSNKKLKRMKTTEPDRARTVWDDRIYELFGTPVFQGKTEEVGDPLFWAPLIARTMGPRAEEILQAGPGDFQSDGGIPFLDIKAWDGNFVKTTTSQRKVPIHPLLIDLGLLRLVDLRRQEGQSRLFPHLKRGCAKGKFSEIFSKKFGYYRMTHGVYWPGLDFHAFRTTFNSDLMNGDKSDAIRCAIMGHEFGDEGARSYGQGLLLETMLKRMTDVRVDLSMIVSPFADRASTTGTRAEKAGLRLVS